MCHVSPPPPCEGRPYNFLRRGRKIFFRGNADAWYPIEAQLVATFWGAQTTWDVTGVYFCALCLVLMPGLCVLFFALSWLRAYFYVVRAVLFAPPTPTVRRFFDFSSVVVRRTRWRYARDAFLCRAEAILKLAVWLVYRPSFFFLFFLSPL